ncbi:MAG: CTP synthase, partial [Myxococcales bacterium]|nr:CTP synthase [Myxococcales bacterium]
AGELKTKPTQHSVKSLLEIGIQPDIIVLRTEQPLGTDIKRKISLFCNVRPNRVITAQDEKTIYALPIALHAEGLDSQVVEALNIWSRMPDMGEWERVVALTTRPSEHVRIAVVGKYVELAESYKSLNEALKHGGLANECKVDIRYVDSEQIDPQASDADVAEALGDIDAVLVPGGFGYRGIEGKIRTVRWAREKKVPFFGICLGMQCAAIEVARDLAGLAGANSTEFDADTPHPVIHIMEAQKQVLDKGATMRLGAYPCNVAADGKVHEAYGKRLISERHRHRFEFNNDYREKLHQVGLVATGVYADLDLVECVELVDHPWFVGVQFHPEYKSRPLKPHPLFARFIGAALQQRKRAHERSGAKSA